MAFLKRHGFALTLAGGMIAFELAIVLLLTFGQPAGQRWLGDTLQVPNDTAVYLADIRQGTWLLRNPYAPEPHAAAFHPVWSVLSAIHGATGASPVLLHEIARILFTIALAFALHAASRSVAETEANARLATLLATGGIGLGWVHAMLLGLFGAWHVETIAAPDLIKEFAVIPTLLGGAHTILSFALLVTVTRGIWKSVHDRMRADVWTCLGVLLLTSFHPYFIPLLLAIIGMAWTKRLGRRPAQERSHGPAIVLLLCLIPAAIYYGWLLSDTVFGTHHLVANIVPLPPFVPTLFAIAPALAALGWLFLRHDREQRFLAVGRWCVAWILASVILLFLPVPWYGKFIQGLMVPLVLLTLPAWVALFQKLARPVAIALLSFIVAAVPLFWIASHATWLQTPERAAWLGRSESLFRAWSFLETRPDAVVLSDDQWVNVWTPAWSGNTVWMGHHHETLDYAFKKERWSKLLENPEVAGTQAFAELPVTHLLLTNPSVTARLLPVLGAGWTPVFQDGDTLVLERRP